MATLRTVRIREHYAPRRDNAPAPPPPPPKYKSLHDAVRDGDVQGVRDFLSTGRDVNETDSSGNTALLLAVCIKQEEIYDAIVAVLIENGADVNAYNKGFTPLYNAVFYKRKTSVEMLLKAGAWLRPSYKNELHHLAEHGGSRILELILDDERCTPEIINRPDDEGRTALHLAAQFCHKNCLRTLIDHGGDLSSTNDDGETVADLVFQQIIAPDGFFGEILDGKIAIKQTDKYKYNYGIDFRVLAPKKYGRQMDVISSVLAAASDEEKIEVLQHPLIELYLILKWERICYFFYLWITAYFIFATSTGVYFNLLMHNAENMETLRTALKYIVILTASGLLAHAILQCVLDRRKYFQRYEMWMNLICTCLALTVAITVDGYSENASDAEFPDWVVHVTSIDILLAWFELMLLIGRLPSLGYYALMFSAVLQNVVKVLLAYACLLIGFTMSFSIQFHNSPVFSNPWRTLAKTVAMMIGEFEYGDLFGEEGADSPRILPVTSRFIFLLFVVLATVVLMNLLVGVAVSDIQELHVLGRAKKLEKQAEFLQQLEAFMSSEHLRSEYVPGIVKKVIVLRSFINTQFDMSCDELQKIHKIPKRITDSLAAIAKGHKQFKEVEN
ncbi:unnamed protein product [Phyllotreta striolata]|uniref:Ion transport domain-containing protein n=1 Tax=Phyllotreta striolata TaxID=444603 RepID=A0A9N9XLI0_PHYSR|nr:unnamed protein product [Phyllotreta striolata]